MELGNNVVIIIISETKQNTQTMDGDETKI